PHSSEHSINQHLTRELRVLRDGRERRVAQRRRRYVVKSHNRDFAGHVDTALLQRVYGADGDEIAGRDDAVDRLAAIQQFACRLQRPCVTTVALEELRILAGSGTQEGDVAAAEVEQVPGGIVTALVVVRAHRQPGLPG